MASCERPGTTALYEPSRNYSGLVARFNRRAFETLDPVFAYAGVGHEITGRRLSLGTPEGSAFWRELVFAWREISRAGDILLRAPVAIRDMEDTLFGALALALNPHARQEGNSEHSRRAPKRLREAEEFIAAHVDQVVSPDEVARATGVSKRTLFRMFRSRHGMGPMGFLKNRRLDATQRDLLAGRPDATTVTEVAVRYGFWHLGRFAVDYKRTFGESPSETLRSFTSFVAASARSSERRP
jgi:AraC-like DNA-binding protein